MLPVAPPALQGDRARWVATVRAGDQELFKSRAREKGVVYSMAYGDQPAQGPAGPLAFYVEIVEKVPAE